MADEQTASGENTNNAASSAAAPVDGTAPADAGVSGTAPASETPEGTKPSDDLNKAPEAAKPATPEGAPEKYEFTLTEGAQLDPEVQKQFEATARELNMTQANAQKLVETMAPKIAAQQQAAFARIQTEWTDAVKADPTLGGDKLDANLAIAKSALARFGTPELTTFLNESGLGNHPEMIRMMFKAGQAISEDKHVPSSQGTAPQRDKAKSLYPNSK